MASFVVPNAAAPVEGRRPSPGPTLERADASKRAAGVGFDGELARQIQVATGDGAAHRGARAEVAATRTPLSGSQAAAALSGAWRAVTGNVPNPKLLSVLVAQWSHETGRGESMLNYNFGGIKGAAPSGLTASYRTHEGSGENARAITDHFRAYRTATEGAVDYVRFLQARVPSALEAAKSGDANGFVHALKQGGYFTDNEESYARSVASLAERAQREGFDSIGATARPAADATYPMPTLASLAQSADGLAIANIVSAPQGGALPFVDSGALANELAQAAMRIAHSTPEDYLNELERLDTRPAT